METAVLAQDASNLLDRKRAEASVASVAIVGAGFSGTMVAVHLAQMLPPDATVLLCERSAFARGAAYATQSPNHFLNVCASGMSAFQDDPSGFARWLETRRDGRGGEIARGAVGEFASRKLYGEYLADIFDARLHQRSGARLFPYMGEVVDIVPQDGIFRILFRTGVSVCARSVVLAMGNIPAPPGAFALHHTNPWLPGATAELRDDMPLLVIGTGLTMIDIALDLDARGFRGGVVALSRHGWLPRRHGRPGAWPTPVFTAHERRSIVAMLRRVRREIAEAARQGGDWRWVIDSLRPITVDLWCGLPMDQRQRFLRHMRTLWDVHRHRVAEPLAERVQTMIAAGTLRIVRGRLERMQEAAGAVDVLYRPYGQTGLRQMRAQRVISAVGTPQIGGTDSALVASLLMRGLVEPDALSLGFNTDARLRPYDSTGRPLAGVWAIGPLARGALWECTAVPDIRQQAEQVAASIAAYLSPAAADDAQKEFA